MKRGISIAIMIICGFIAFQSYSNAKAGPQVKPLSRESACAGVEGCEVKGDEPSVLMTSTFDHQYQWGTTKGSVVVTCKREYVFVGKWGCTSRPGELAH